MTVQYQNLLGLKFVHGKQDCFEIGRMFYKQNWGIEIPNFVRPDGWWEAGESGLNLYMRHFHECGFSLLEPRPRVQDMWPGDVIFMAIESKVANHCGIWLGEENWFLHHYYGRLSEKSRWKHLYWNTTVAILRHKDVPPPNTSKDTVDVMDLLPANVRAKLQNAGAA
jgi:hypothetical protein